ncbi:hypothetical protein Nmel_018661 [Mimus melanotis]
MHDQSIAELIDRQTRAIDRRAHRSPDPINRSPSNRSPDSIYRSPS